VDWGITLALGIGFILGLAADLVRHLLSLKAADRNRHAERQRQELDEAYAPAVRMLEQMIDAHPNHEQERVKLDTLISAHTSYFDQEDLELLNVALSRVSQMDDLIRVRSVIASSANSRRER